MPRNDLPLGQVTPAAQPVESFIQPARIDPAAPARPSALPQGPQIGMVQRASGGNVQSNYNDLAQALAPFNANLTKLLYTGAELYASHEYKQGQNEAMRAFTLANRQMLQSEAEYGSVNRKLAQANPMAALAMDNANPFRQGGRMNQLSQLAGGVIESRLSTAYQNNRMRLAQLDPGSPEINALKASVISQTAKDFGINESSPGFIDYVMPKVTQGWDKITERQIADRNAYMKDAAKNTLLAQLQQIGINGLANGRSQSEIVEAWTRAVDQQVGVAGLPGEASEIAKTAITGASQMFLKGGKSNLASWLGGIAVGAPDKDGFRPSAAMVLGPDLIIANDKISDIQWKEYQHGQEMQGMQFDNDVANAVMGLDDGPAKQAALNALMNSPKYAGLSTARKLQGANSVSTQAADFTTKGQDPEQFEQWFTGWDRRYGTAWDSKKMLAELDGALASVPDKERPRARERVRDLMNTKDRQKQDMPNAAINVAVQQAVKANNAIYYPTLEQAAMRRASGAQIEQTMAWGLANLDASTARQTNAYKKAIYNALDVETAKKGGPLTQAEKETVIGNTISGFQKNAPETWKTLFPGVEGHAPSVKPGGTLQANPDGGKAPAAVAGPKPYQGQTFSAGTLDNAPEDRLKSWRSEPLLKKESAVDVVEAVLNGGGFPAPLVRAAKKAGTTPGQLVLQNLDSFYPGEVKLSPEDRRTLLKKGQEVSSIDRYSNAVASSSGSPVWQHAAEWALRVIAPPAMAAEPTFPQVAMRMQTAPAGRPGALPAGTYDFGGLASLMFKGEGGFNSYNTGTVGSGSKPLNLTGMSIGDVAKLQRSGKVFAVGFAQWASSGNLLKAMKSAGLTPQDGFSPENQMKMFWGYVLNSDKQPALRDYLRGGPTSLQAAHQAFAGEWAAMQGPSGRGNYDGDSAGNFASVSAATVRRALIAARRAISGR